MATSRLLSSQALSSLGLKFPLRLPHPRLTIRGRYYSSKTDALRSILNVSPEVEEAVATNKPVVALETTIYTHGALGDDLLLEDIVRQHGAIPAVCGILDGVPSVGLSKPEVARMVSEGARKASRRDLAYVVGTVCRPPMLSWPRLRTEAKRRRLRLGKSCMPAPPSQAPWSWPDWPASVSLEPAG